MKRKSLFIPFILVASSLAVAADIAPYKAQTVKPYQAQAVKPHQAQTVKPYQAQTVKPVQAQGVKQYQSNSVRPMTGQTVSGRNSSGQIEMYRAQEAKRYTQEDFDRMNAQTREEAKRIAAQRKGNVDPNASANQLYWQQQIMHRGAEAANPDITYHGR